MLTILGLESRGQPLVVAHSRPDSSMASVSAQTSVVLSCTSRLTDHLPPPHTVTLLPVTSCYKVKVMSRLEVMAVCIMN